MILGKISSAERYYALHPRFQAAFEFVNDSIKKLDPGKYPIDGDNLYVTIVNGNLKKEDDAYLEAHDRYIDIQVVLSGNEKHGWKDRTVCGDVKSGYDSVKDILFYYDKPASYVDVNEDEFVVFFPEDAHAPMIGEGLVTKAIVKVKI